MSFRFEDLANKTVVLTGAAWGIGRGLTPGLLEQGLRLVLIDRDADQLAENAAALDDGRITCLHGDLSDPGDRARLLPDGRIELLGRESVTVNSGGEKIFVEEVEQALKEHPAVYDAVVTGRPSQRWGQEVVAVVQLTGGARADEGSLRAACAERLASFKLPKAFVFVDTVERSPAGKADYAWARKMAEEAP